MAGIDIGNGAGGVEIEVEKAIGVGVEEVALLMVWPQAVLNDDYLSATSRHGSYCVLPTIANILAAI